MPTYWWSGPAWPDSTPPRSSPDLRRPVSLTSSRDEYRVGDMTPLYEATAATAVDAGVPDIRTP
ncbi:hypothetical protein ABZ800_10590 [Streptomyces sp. NPDC047813]|uniref:hypothetical protein n=1 Tax=Streptomyces sp. NPDC047813 TaxID=3154608 RepID=UPI0033D5DAA4